MKVILLRDVARMGRRFEVKEVPSGHALNFLIPKKLAQMATPENLKRVTEQQQKNAQTIELQEHQFDEAVAKLSEKPIEILASANEQGHLFKGIKADDIAKQLQSQGVMLSETHVVIEHPLKALGDYTIDLALGKKKGSFTLRVISK